MSPTIGARNPGSWSARLWTDIEPIFAAILTHPFITGLTDGSLDEDAFARYVAQDVHYLRDYARALAIVGAKAPTLVDTAMFARHAAEVFDVELALHSTLLPELGLDPTLLGAIPSTPTTLAYTSYLLATAYGGSFADGLAAVLPCYWIYAEVGAALLARGSSDRRYQLLDRQLRRRRIRSHCRPSSGTCRPHRADADRGRGDRRSCPLRDHRPLRVDVLRRRVST